MQIQEIHKEKIQIREANSHTLKPQDFDKISWLVLFEPGKRDVVKTFQDYLALVTNSRKIETIQIHYK